jgi:hypothetical protein
MNPDCQHPSVYIRAGRLNRQLLPVSVGRHKKPREAVLSGAATARPGSSKRARVGFSTVEKKSPR